MSYVHQLLSIHAWHPGFPAADRFFSHLRKSIFFHRNYIVYCLSVFEATARAIAVLVWYRNCAVVTPRQLPVYGPDCPEAAQPHSIYSIHSMYIRRHAVLGRTHPWKKGLTQIVWYLSGKAWDWEIDGRQTESIFWSKGPTFSLQIYKAVSIDSIFIQRAYIRLELSD